MRLVVHKKCTGFLQWLGDVSSDDTVLLVTDWREAKPIMEGMQEVLRPLVRMCIIAPNQKSHRSACKWVASEPRDPEIPILQGFAYEDVRQVVEQHVEATSIAIARVDQATVLENSLRLCAIPQALEGKLLNPKPKS